MTLAATHTRARQSHIFEREADEFYVEPKRCSERLFELLALRPGTRVWDPACGFGRIVRAAVAAGLDGRGTDLRARWEGNPDGPHASQARFYRMDFFASEPGETSDAIVSNPPFDRAQDFTDLALRRSSRMVALLLPTKWLNGTKRSAWRRTTPLYLVMPINPRPSMPPGHLIAAGQKPGGGTVDFSWYVWLHGYRDRPMVEDCMLPEGGKA